MIVDLAASAAYGLTPVDVQVLAGNETGTLEVQDPLDDVVNFADAAEWVKRCEGLVAFWVLHRGLDDAKGDHVHSHSA
jgi:hypothetical protein